MAVYVWVDEHGNETRSNFASPAEAIAQAEHDRDVHPDRWQDARVEKADGTVVWESPE